ncbi:PROPROTEIN CONVERTASE SUBTILISIN/KEXIN [Salix koriyanagi]|uniref:PROPROTEIN CONVERTASE SUBTILISIN/KEXIN n=1 Tax=Salix koriyanagi TaxID=2511006 RepID=A0A9Q0U3M7_9ROSI|nr:PROPROTEIN CONVERTASE SUBTILISIN/KEXIN [Salix koriyanagi]
MIFRTSLLLLAFMAAKASAASIDQQTYIVHMDKNKMPDLYDSLGNSRQWYESIIDSIAQFSSQEQEEDQETGFPQLLYTYETVTSGFAAKLSTKQVEALSRVDGFLSAIPDEILTLHTTHTPRFLGLQGGKGLWDAQNLASDVIVGILDTGIWPEHVSFQDSGLSAVPLKWKGKCESGTKFSPSNCNKKLIGARAFFKGYESVVGRINETIDYRSPRDTQGHGTHTAATAAGNLVDKASFYGLANGSAAGMRYTARIAAYKVCWASGCVNSDLLAAIDQAVADGVDVLSLSLGGSAKPFYSDSIAIASFGAVQKGVFVSCSAGNLGPSISSVDNNAPWIMTVAASYTDRKFPTTVRLGNGQTFEGASLYSGKATAQLPLVYAGTAGGQGAQYCISGSLKKNVEIEGDELFADAHVLPATALRASAGIAVKEYMNSSKRATASIVFEGTVYGDPAPMVAAFSSRGPSLVGPDVIKPDVTAPGVNILAAWPSMTSPTRLKSDKRRVLFNVISGTSMSCPHVSGLAALLKSAHKKWSPAAIKSALMTTAYVTDNSRSPIADVGSSNSAPATPFTFGSGHVDPESASDPGLIYDITIEDYVNYFCSLNYTSSQIAQLSRRNVTCPGNKALQPGDLNYPSFAVNFEGSAHNNRVKYKRTLTNVGTTSSTYAVKVEEPNGVSVILEPKSLSFKNLGQKLSYNVTFVSSSGKGREGSSSFGSLVWLSGKYSVRSPIAVTWQ